MPPNTARNKRTDAEQATSSPTSWLAGALILALCAVNLLLIRQNFSLRRQLEDRGKKSVDVTANSLRRADVVPSVAGTDLNGQPYRLEYKQDGRRRVLLFLSPTCPYCLQQAPLWRDLLDKVDGSRFSVVGVIGDSEDRRAVIAHAEELGYFKARANLPILVFDEESLRRYKLVATPTTLLISGDGKVEKAWVGKWDEAKTNEVATALK